jgi:hypothetical protein
MFKMRSAKYAGLTALMWLLGMTPASATLIDAIHALNPGDKYRVLFVTSTTTGGQLSDINTYNSFVQNAAAAGSVTSSLGLTWRALASTRSVDAQTNSSVLSTDASTVRFFNTLGQLVAFSGADLWDGSLAAPIIATE